MQKVWFIGEAPVRVMSRRALAPLGWECGRRLCHWGGLKPQAFVARTEFRVLFARRPLQWKRAPARDRWDNRVRADLMLASIRGWGARLTVVALGTRVRDAVTGLSDYPPYTMVQDAMWDIAWMPAPTAITRPYDIDMAETFLQRVFKEAAMAETTTKPIKAPVKKPMTPKAKPAPKRTHPWRSE
jgi:hypothetical protein